MQLRTQCPDQEQAGPFIGPLAHAVTIVLDLEYYGLFIPREFYQDRCGIPGRYTMPKRV